MHKKYNKYEELQAQVYYYKSTYKETLDFRRINYFGVRKITQNLVKY